MHTRIAQDNGKAWGLTLCVDANVMLLTERVFECPTISQINDEEIENIFRRANSQLDEIDANANKEKRTVVKELAIELEGQIPLDTISIEIVTQLRGIVSERFIRECLDNKYKQGYRTVNANRQKEKRQKEKSKILAAVTPLNQKTAIMTLTNGDSVDPIRIVTEKVSMEEIHDDTPHLNALIALTAKN